MCYVNINNKRPKEKNTYYPLYINFKIILIVNDMYYLHIKEKQPEAPLTFFSYKHYIRLLILTQISINHRKHEIHIT